MMRVPAQGLARTRAFSMKAIETRYKGYRFRSRLEARWAVFFDALGLSWEYEPEGFETDAGWYLPDFKVHFEKGFEFWLEIKGKMPTNDEIRKCEALASGTGQDVYMACGNIGAPTQPYGLKSPALGGPVIRQMGVKGDCNYPIGHINYNHEFIEKACKFNSIRLLGFCEYADGTGLDIQTLCLDDWGFDKSGLMISEQLVMEYNIDMSAIIEVGVISKGRAFRSPRILNAYEAARSARFEHGETP